LIHNVGGGPRKLPTKDKENLIVASTTLILAGANQINMSNKGTNYTLYEGCLTTTIKGLEFVSQNLKNILVEENEEQTLFPNETPVPKFIIVDGNLSQCKDLLKQQGNG
jgi:hypothetical protein